MFTHNSPESASDRPGAKKKAGLSRAGGILFGAVFTLFGLVALVLGIVGTVRSLDSVNWPQVDGVVTHSEIESSSSGKGGATYGADIRYEYRTPSGEKLTGTRVGYIEYSSSDASHARETLARYPLGKQVKVHVSPSDQTSVVLEPGFTLFLLIPLVLGTIFIAVGGGIVIAAARGKLGKNNAPGAADAHAHAAGAAVLPAGDARHAQLKESSDFSGLTFSVPVGSILPKIILAIGLLQLVVTNLIPDLPLAARLMGVPVTLVGLALILARTRVRVDAREVSLAIGIGKFGFRKAIPRSGPMRVELAHRGASVNNKPVDAIVVSNGAGEEIAFGNFLKEPLKKTFAARLAHELGAKATPAEVNPNEPASVAAAPDNPFA